MPTSTTPGQRFTQLIQELGLTKNAFAQSLGKTATVIQHIVDERNKPGYDLLNKVCEIYPNVASDWLVLGQGPMLRADSPAPAAPEPAPPPAPNGIDPEDIPPAPRRRPGPLLQPADIAATLALAAPGPAGHSNGHGHATPTAPPVAAAPPLVAAPPPLASPAPPGPPTAASQPVAPVAPLGLPAAPAPAAPDPTYLAAALHTLQLQHQLALAEQRNQHLLEQQALLRQLVEVLQKV